MDGNTTGYDHNDVPTIAWTVASSVFLISIGLCVCLLFRYPYMGCRKKTVYIDMGGAFYYGACLLLLGWGAAATPFSHSFYITPCEEVNAMPGAPNNKPVCNDSHPYNAYCYPLSAANALETLGHHTMDTHYPTTSNYSTHPNEWAGGVMAIAGVVGTTSAGTDPESADTINGLQSYARALVGSAIDMTVTYVPFSRGTPFWNLLASALQSHNAVLLHLTNGAARAVSTNAAGSGGNQTDPILIPNESDSTPAPFPDIPGGSTLGHTIAVYSYTPIDATRADLHVAWGAKLGTHYTGDVYLYLDPTGITGSAVTGFTRIQPEAAEKDDGLSTGAIVGISIGATIVGGLLVEAIVTLVRRKRAPPKQRVTARPLLLDYIKG